MTDIEEWEPTSTGEAISALDSVTTALANAETVEDVTRARSMAEVAIAYIRRHDESQAVILRAQEVMRPLMKQVDLVIANEEDIQSVLGLEVASTNVTAGQLSLAGYEQVAREVSRTFGPGLIAITLRESFSASDNGWSAVLWDDARSQFIRSQRYDVRLVDRIGGGDSFAAGLIYALVSERNPEAALRFAVAASALKQTIPGDFNRVSLAEVDRLVQGDASGRVQR